MSDSQANAARVTEENPLLSELTLSWRTAEYSAEDGMGPMGSLHEAGDALVAVAQMVDGETTILGSGVMVGPGLLLTSTHVLDEFPSNGPRPLFLTFLPCGARAWLPIDRMTASGPSKFSERREVVSDITLVSCMLHSEAYVDQPLMLAPMEVALPLLGDRLWAMGIRHQDNKEKAALITPFVSSGLVTAAFPSGRGERMASPCLEVEMDTMGGMSGGPVFNADGFLVGIISSSFEGGPSYITLIWDALRFRVKGTIPKLMKNKTVSLMGAKQLGLAKLKGSIVPDWFGGVTLKLSKEEWTLLATSISVEEQNAIKPNHLNKNQLEIFLDTWGSDLEGAVLEGTLLFLNQLSLSSIQDLLEPSEIPIEYLEEITKFSVEDFDGLEDILVTRTEKINDFSFRLFCDYEIPIFVWTVEIPADFAQAHMDELGKLFLNFKIENDIAKMEICQRRYFRGSIVFHSDNKVFTEIAITLSAVKL